LNILILNGSPKGKNSVTLHTALYLERCFPQHVFETLNVGHQIKFLEKDFIKAKQALEKADLIIFCYPVYTFIAPYQLHRFIELMKQNDVNISGKFTAQISTSKHFYDITAHKFIEENCYDFELKYLGGLSADMDDLLSEKGRKQARQFFEKLMFDISQNIYSARKTLLHSSSQGIYKSSLPNCAKRNGKKTVVITNIANEDENLRNMIDDFKNACCYEVREINVRKYPFSGGCLGCFNCAISGKCIYKDGFDEFLRSEVQTADGMIIAFAIENHYTHSSFKCFDDRQFCNGHRTVTTGKSIGYIISGNYSAEQNLQTTVEARSDVGGMYFCGVAGDEQNTTEQIKHLASTFEYALENRLTRPQSFYGVGGTKIFRDLVYLMQGLMQADHKFYKSHGIYDFPQKRKGMLIGMKLLGLVMNVPKVQKQMRLKMSEYIISPYQKVLENANKKEETK
jgi:multimeric flavodoxin WrbA